MPTYVDLKIRVKAKIENTEKATAGSARFEEVPYFSEAVKETLALGRNATEWNEFFTEWVAQPFSNKLRKSFEEIDDRLRVLDPSILPTWSTLYELFKELGTCEEGVNLLPSKVEYAYRLDDEKAPSAKLITLWRQLRKIARRERISSVSIREGYVKGPEAVRRRRGG